VWFQSKVELHKSGTKTLLSGFQEQVTESASFEDITATTRLIKLIGQSKQSTNHFISRKNIKKKNSALNKIAWPSKIRYEDYNVLIALYKIVFHKKLKNKKCIIVYTKDLSSSKIIHITTIDKLNLESPDRIER
jgi:hypothetical protein